MTTITIRDALESGRVTFSASWPRDCIFYLCNNHILLSVFFAHEKHPYGKVQRGLVLFNSLSFAYFITAVLHVFVPNDLARGAIGITLGTILQLLFDLPASMLGTCPCAHGCFPPFVQGTCRGFALACLSLHTCASFIFGLLGAGALAAGHLLTNDETMPQVVWDNFVASKTNAFIGAVPWNVITYAILRQCEVGDGVGVQRETPTGRDYGSHGMV